VGREGTLGVPARHLAPWKEQFTFLDAAERDFDRLPPRVQQAFLDTFPEFTRHPWRATRDLDVAPLRDMPGRWRLKVAGGHRGVYRDLHGRPDFEVFETREQVYRRLRRYVDSRR
jgi:hypothetical protein